MKLMDVDLWEEIFDSLSRNKARSFLTAFGIFWGVFMLLLLMGGGKGVQSMLGQNLGGFASNAGFMIANTTSKPHKGLARDRAWTIDLDDVAAVSNCVPEVEVCTPSIRRWGATATADNRAIGVQVSGERADYIAVEDPKIRIGRGLNAIDDAQARKVCVVGSRIVTELFPDLGPDGDPCGRFIKVDGVAYCIVGVSGKGENGLTIGGSATTIVHLPYSTMQHTYNRGKEVDILCLTAKSQVPMSAVQTKVESLLKRRHLIHPDDTQAVIKVNTEAVFSMIDSLFVGVSILVWMIGLGTLIAGAIGVSNIMIVTVKERTTEIGIRRAIGATPRNILVMIMAESLVLTLVAGMSGITFAAGLLHAVERGAGEEGFQISFSLAVGAALLLSLLGLIAGLAPALRAMNIKPVEAMRED
ncbi:MAG: ABC transporter permease [Bacteroidaceae bacterium]|nr:ABC transporter permease [Bacteroidaceae bacterium]